MDLLSRALPDDGLIETLRPLLPVGYAHVAECYRAAAAGIDVASLSGHYRGGLDDFESELAPHVRRTVERLSGGAWDLSDHVAFAAGSDVDFMTHLVSHVAADADVALYPGDWWGFRVGCANAERIRWDASGAARLACLCIPSVRNGHVSEEMRRFLGAADANLWNLNLYPTLLPAERHAIATRLAPLLPRAVISVSFSRGFGMTASQLGVALVPRSHPYLARFETAWRWLTYFHNAFAADAFRRVDLDVLAEVDARRREWVKAWLEERGLPWVPSGSYYVRSFRVEGALPARLAPLSRGDVVRLCFEPPIH